MSIRVANTHAKNAMPLNESYNFLDVRDIEVDGRAGDRAGRGQIETV
ncbi:hypothetical protein HED63_23030 [Ochrobactrum cytisi]|nr:hypothetical protein [Brucella cytisi]NKC51917.1 hypothetical protein [Brucella cytisi]